MERLYAGGEESVVSSGASGAGAFTLDNRLIGVMSSSTKDSGYVALITDEVNEAYERAAGNLGD